eukprot:2669928-Pleurochrysis_carterae.AAC.3
MWLSANAAPHASFPPSSHTHMPRLRRGLPSRMPQLASVQVPLSLPCLALALLSPLACLMRNAAAKRPKQHVQLSVALSFAASATSAADELFVSLALHLWAFTVWTKFVWASTVPRTAFGEATLALL